MKKIFRYLRKFTMIVNDIIVTALLTIVYVCLIIPYSTFMKDKLFSILLFLLSVKKNNTLVDTPNSESPFKYASILFVAAVFGLYE